MNRGQAAKFNFVGRRNLVAEQSFVGYEKEDEPCPKPRAAGRNQSAQMKIVKPEELDCVPLKRVHYGQTRTLNEPNRIASKFGFEDSTSSFSSNDQSEDTWPAQLNDEYQQLKTRVLGEDKPESNTIATNRLYEDSMGQIVETLGQQPLRNRWPPTKRNLPVPPVPKHQPEPEQEANEAVQVAPQQFQTIELPSAFFDQPPSQQVIETIMEKITITPAPEASSQQPPQQEVDIQTQKRFRIRSSRGGSLNRITGVEYTHSIFSFSNPPKPSVLSEKLALLRAIGDQLTSVRELAKLIQQYFENYSNCAVEHISRLNQHQTKTVRTHLFLEFCSLGCLAYMICNGNIDEVHRQTTNMLNFTVKNCQFYSGMSHQPDINAICRMADNNGIITNLITKLLKDELEFMTFFKDGLKSFYKQRHQQHAISRRLRELLCRAIHTNHTGQHFKQLCCPPIPYLEGTTSKPTLIINVDGLLVSSAAHHQHSNTLPIRSHSTEFLRSLANTFEIVAYSSRPLTIIDELLTGIENTAAGKLFTGRLYEYHNIYNCDKKKYVIDAAALGRRADKVIVLAASPQIRQNFESRQDTEEVRTLYVRPWINRNGRSAENSLPGIASYLKNVVSGRPLSRLYPHRRGSTL